MTRVVNVPTEFSLLPTACLGTWLWLLTLFLNLLGTRLLCGSYITGQAKSSPSNAPWLSQGLTAVVFPVFYYLAEERAQVKHLSRLCYFGPVMSGLREEQVIRQVTFSPASLF